MHAFTLDLHTLAGICRRRAIRLLAMFGSAVRGVRGPDSDLDLAVWVEEPRVEPLDLAELEAELSPLFAAERLDLTILNRVSPLVQFQVAKHGSPLFEAQSGVFQAFRVSASKRHADTAHLRSLDRICVDRLLRRQAPMIDRELIHRKLAQLAQYLGELEPLHALAYEDYLRQPLSRYAAERLLQLLVDTAVDVNAHLAVELMNTPPQDYHDSFVKAAQAGVLPADFALSIAQSAGLRNRLVHQYEAVDHVIVYRAIPEAIEQYTQYCRHVTAFLDRDIPPSTR